MKQKPFLSAAVAALATEYLAAQIKRACSYMTSCSQPEYGETPGNVSDIRVSASQHLIQAGQGDLQISCQPFVLKKGVQSTYYY